MDKEGRPPYGGSMSFWYRIKDGRYKTVCRTEYPYMFRHIGKARFRIKVFFYKMMHKEARSRVSSVPKITSSRSTFHL